MLIFFLLIQVFAMVAGEWLCVYDIRINKPMVKESTHAGEATCVDWHPTKRYIIATGGGRDRSVKGLDLTCRYFVRYFGSYSHDTFVRCSLGCGEWFEYK